MDAELKREAKAAWKEIGKEMWQGWKWIFVIQVIIGSHALYTLAPELGDMSFLYYTFILLFISAIAATILLIVVTVLFIVLGSAIVGFQLWREGRKEREKQP